MNEVLTVYAIFSAAVIFVCWSFFSVSRAYRVAALRQHIFEIRDELFDQADAGKIPFQSKAYGMSRTVLNGMVRNAHKLSFFHIITSMLFMKVFAYQDDHFKNTFNQSMNKLTDEQKKIINDTHLRLFVVVTYHLVHISIIFAPIVLLIRGISVPVRFIDNLADRMSRTIESLTNVVASSLSGLIRWGLEEEAYSAMHEGGLIAA